MVKKKVKNYCSGIAILRLQDGSKSFKVTLFDIFLAIFLWPISQAPAKHFTVNDNNTCPNKDSKHSKQVIVKILFRMKLKLFC